MLAGVATRRVLTDEVFRDLVLARIIEPTSKLDADRVLEEVGVPAASYATLKRRLPGHAAPDGAHRNSPLLLIETPHLRVIRR